MDGKPLVKTLILSLVIFMPFICMAQNLLSGPQKIVIDSKRNRLLVSNFNTGDIVAIDSAGNQSYFKQNANFVDGLEIVGDTVFGVGNSRIISAYDLVTGQLVMEDTLPGNAGNYLSSIAYDSAGHLFISCPYLHTIYRMRISDGSCWVFASGNGLYKPNGILLERENNRIVVIDDSPGSVIHAISLADSTVSTLMTTGFYSPDGIVRDKYGYYYVGGYYLAGLFRIDPGFSQPPDLFYTGANIVYPTYDPSDHSLLVTHYNDSTWERVPLFPIGMTHGDRKGGAVLSPGTPNPFISSVTVRCRLERKDHTRIDILNSMGIIVRTMVNEVKEPGIYTVSWDGKDSSGHQVPCGNYFFRMKSGSSVQTQKVILVK